MCRRASGKPPACARIVRFRSGIIVCAILFSLTSIQSAHAQMVGPGNGLPKPMTSEAESSFRRDPTHDPMLIRELYRFRPRMATELESELKSAGTIKAQKKILKGYAERLGTEMKIVTDLHSMLRSEKNAIWKLESAAYIISELRGSPFRKPGKSKKYVEKIKFEDKIIKELGFKDYRELYDFLRTRYPSDLGTHYMSELKRTKDYGGGNFDDQIDLLERSLKFFRTSPKAGRDSILPKLSPVPPALGFPSAKDKKPKTSSDTRMPKRQGKLSSCKQICDNPLQTAAGRGWCWAHCKDNVRP